MGSPSDGFFHSELLNFPYDNLIFEACLPGTGIRRNNLFIRGNYII